MTLPNTRSRDLFSLKADNLVPLVIVLLLLHLALWTFFTGISHRAPDWDNMEELVWASGLEWGYYKHPPLPSWILHFLISVFGRPVWLTFFTGQASVVLSLWLIWKFGCEITSQRRALIATLIMSPITYFTVRGVMNNHNTMQLWAIAGAIWMFYRAVHTDSLRAWAALGFLCACAFLTKYSALVQFSAFFVYLLTTGHLKRVATWKGIALSTTILLAMITPHLLWLKHQASGPLSYASSEMGPMPNYTDELSNLFDFSLTNFARIAPMILAMIIIAVWAARSHKKQSAGNRTAKMADELKASDRYFVLLIGIAPLAFTMLIAGAMKVPLAAHWATTFFMLFGFFAFWVLRADDDVAMLRKTIVVIVTMQIIGSIGYGLARGPLADHLGRTGRATFPGAKLSQQINAEWQKRMHIPLTVVASDTWIGGNIATHIGRNVNVLIDGDYQKSPWVNAEQAKQCGMLVAINRSKNDAAPVEPAITALMAQATEHGIIEMPWTKKVNGPTVVVEWGIIPASENCKITQKTTN